MFEEYADRYDEWYTRHASIFESELKAIRSFELKGLGLDLGVGTGVFAERLGVPVGIDPSARMLIIAKKRGIQVIQALGERLPFRGNSFDYDLIGQAMGGIMSITGWPDTPPTRTGTAIADVLAGLNCCIGTLAALRARDTTRVGRKVDVSLVDSVVSALENLTEMYLVTGESPTRIGNRYEFVYPYDTFRTKDGWVAIAVGNDEIWQRFCEATGNEELGRDPKYQTNAKRVGEHESLKAAVTEWTTKRATGETVSYLLSHKIPAAPVYGVRDIVEDPHIAKAREMVLDMDQPGVGRMKVVGCPIKMPGTGLWRPAPRLGEHTTEVLAELLKMTEGQIEKLKLGGAV